MKALALYLPQYHCIKENNEWWGEGYTEWTAVKGAVPYFAGHKQPKVPLYNNYYDLADESGEVWKWQAGLARKYNIYGFVIYHYWFGNNRQLLEKPMEILLRYPEINIKYCVCWANETWRRNWYNMEEQILMEQLYGNEEEWEKHFYYLLPFFKDKRYILINNKPMVNIYHTKEIDNLREMTACWNRLAIANGFFGVYIVSGYTTADTDERKDLCNAYYYFEPAYTIKHDYGIRNKMKYRCRTCICTVHNKIFSKKKLERIVDGNKVVLQMQKRRKINGRMEYPGVFVQWDNTPRRQYKGSYFKNMSVENFKKQLKNVKEQYSESEFVYINAWNEWGEGAYLEPDEMNQYSFLEAVSEEFENES